MVEPAKKKKIKKTAVANFLIVLSCLTIFQTISMQLIYFEKKKCQGEKGKNNRPVRHFCPQRYAGVQKKASFRIPQLLFIGIALYFILSLLENR